MQTALTSSGSEAPELYAVRARKLELKRRRLEILKENGIYFYRPSPKQDAFHRALARRRLVRAGNRFGKSHMGCAEDCAWLLGERPWYPEGDPARYGGIPRKPNKGLVVTTNLEKVSEVWTGPGGKIWSLLPKSFVKRAIKNTNGVITSIECANGSLLKFYTTKQWLADPDTAESSDYDFLHIDEPCPRGLYVAVARGLVDRCGSEWFTLTPLSEPWIAEEFFLEDGGLKPNCWVITGTIYDNPTLTEEAIKEFASKLSDDERECRLNGIPLHLAGLVYKEFHWDVHVLKEPPLGWKSFEEPPEDWPVYVAIDPHPQTPHAVLFCTVSPFGKRYYFYDMFVHCGITHLVKGFPERNIQGILPFLKGRRPVWTKMDPLGFVLDPEDENCMAEEAARAGLPVEKATKALAQGILLVKQELLKRDMNGQPVIYFCPTARRTLWEIRRWSWDEKENKPIDRDDHMMENLYRLEISQPRWVEQTRTRSIEDISLTVPELDLERISYVS